MMSVGQMVSFGVAQVECGTLIRWLIDELTISVHSDAFPVSNNNTDRNA